MITVSYYFIFFHTLQDYSQDETISSHRLFTKEKLYTLEAFEDKSVPCAFNFIIKLLLSAHPFYNYYNTNNMRTLNCFLTFELPLFLNRYSVICALFLTTSFRFASEVYKINK